MNAERFLDGDGATAVTHPYGFFDDGRTEDAVERLLDIAPGEAVLVEPAVGTRNVGEPHAAGRYDRSVTDRDGYGWLQPEDAADLSGNDYLLLAGGFREDCLPGTYHSVDGPRVGVVPEATYGRAAGLDTLFDGDRGDRGEPWYADSLPELSLDALAAHTREV